MTSGVGASPHLAGCGGGPHMLQKLECTGHSNPGLAPSTGDLGGTASNPRHRLSAAGFLGLPSADSNPAATFHPDQGCE